MPDRQSKAATAVEMAGRQREISVSEFFLKNRHLLGFDTPAKALVTAVKEAVDNALDACEEAGLLPEITVQVRDRFGKSRIVVEDNGPGIVESQIARIFGKLLYGSKFHKLSQSRGQQGMGISAAGMYGQLTVGKPLHIISRSKAMSSPRSFTCRLTPRITGRTFTRRDGWNGIALTGRASRWRWRAIIRPEHIPSKSI